MRYSCHGCGENLATLDRYRGVSVNSQKQVRSCEFPIMLEKSHKFFTLAFDDRLGWPSRPGWATPDSAWSARFIDASIEAR